MKRYYINYRGEFTIVIDAEDEEQALDIAESTTRGWESINNLHREFLEVIDTENLKRLYTFVDENNEIITQVRAENHDIAVAQVQTTKGLEIDSNTDFYSEIIED